MAKRRQQKLTVAFVPLEPDEAKKREEAILKILAYGAHLCALEKQPVKQTPPVSFIQTENETVLKTIHSFS